MNIGDKKAANRAHMSDFEGSVVNPNHEVAEKILRFLIPIAIVMTVMFLFSLALGGIAAESWLVALFLLLIGISGTKSDPGEEPY